VVDVHVHPAAVVLLERDPVRDRLELVAADGGASIAGPAVTNPPGFGLALAVPKAIVRVVSAATASTSA
jgi:hypothetical protein